MTSKLVVNTIEADTGISSVSFASSISMSSTSKFHFSAAGVDIGADTNINRPAAGVLGFNISGAEKLRIDTNGHLNTSGIATASNFKTGSSNLHSTGLTVGNNFLHTTGINVGTGATIHVPSSNVLTLGTNSSERLRIYSDGRILIGNGGSEHSPQGNLDIVGDTNSNGPELYLRVSNNNTADNIGALLFGNNVDKSVVKIQGVTHTANNTGDLTFHTSTTGTMGERLRITSDGKIGMGLESTSGSICTPDGNALLIRAASTVGTVKGHIMLTGDGATNGEGPQIVFSESGSGGNFAGAYIGHTRTGSNSVGNLVFATRATGGDASTIPTVALTLSDSQTATFAGTVSDSIGDLRSIPRNNQGSAYTLVASDVGKCITAAGNITVNNSVFSSGDVVSIIADTGSDITITQGSGVTMYNTGDASTGSKTLAARGMCTIWFVAANNCYLSGSGIS